MPIIELPNGQNADFPDAMSLDEIKSVIQKKFPPTQSLGAQENAYPTKLQDLIPLLKDKEQFNKEFGKSVGIAASFMQPQIGLAKLLGAEGLPAAAKGLVNYLGNVGTGTAATLAAGGNTFSTPNLGSQAKEAAGINAAFELLPPAIKGIGRAAKGVIEKAQPAKYAEEIMRMLGSGKTVEENSKDLAQSLKNSYEKRLKEAQSNYKPVLDKYGDQRIYETKNPSGIHAYTEKPKFNEIGRAHV